MCEAVPKAKNTRVEKDKRIQRHRLEQKYREMKAINLNMSCRLRRYNAIQNHKIIIYSMDSVKFKRKEQEEGNKGVYKGPVSNILQESNSKKVIIR